MRWRHHIITPAVAQVLSLDEAKAELDVDFGDDDALIQGHISSAVAFVQDYTNRFLAPTTVELQLEGFGPTISIPFAPVTEVVSLQYVDGAGTLVAAPGYRALPGEPYLLNPPLGSRWPFARQEAGSVRLRFIAGYPEGQVPPGLLQAVKLATRAFYELPAGKALEEELEAVRAVAGPHRFAYL